MGYGGVGNTGGGHLRCVLKIDFLKIDVKMYFTIQNGVFTMAIITVKIRQKWLIAPHSKALYKVYTLHSLHSPFGVSGVL